VNSNRGVLLALGVVAVVLGGVLLLGRPSSEAPLDPRSHEPIGTSALVRLLRQLDVDVDVNVRDLDDLDPDTDVVLVLRDRMDADQRATLVDWVEDGGTVVASDPGSPLTPRVDTFTLGDSDDPAVFAIDELVETGAGICDIPPLDDERMDRLEVYGGPVEYDIGAGADSCFGSGGSAYIVATPEGSGTIVAIGGSGILINRSLDEADNAPVAAALLAPQPGMRVAVLDPSAPLAEGQGDKSLRDLVSPGVKRALLQLGLAFLVYALWRARRLGKPVPEPQPVAVAGSELVSAVGGLLQRAGSPQHAADLLRDDLRRDLVSRLGLPPHLPAPTFVAVVAERTRLDADRIAAALGPSPVTSDGELLTVAQLIDAVRKEVFDHVGS
jgi:hypothetical protein